VTAEAQPATKLPRLDRLIAWLAPNRALRRARARVALQLVRYYEGAARSRRTEGWRVGSGTSANAELAPALGALRDRSRDLVRNNPYGRRAVRHTASSLVGYGITGTVVGPDAQRVPLQAAWDAFVCSPQCDHRGKQTFGGLQRLVARTFAESGEVLARRVWDDAAPMGLRVQVLEPDYLDSASTLLPLPSDLRAGHRIVAGVEVDADDRPAAYWLLPHHPGDVLTSSTGGLLAQPVRVPAADVAHVYDEERPGQARGCPLLAPATIRLRDLDEYEDAQLQRQKIAACFAAFYLTPDGGTRTRSDALCDHVEPGMTEELPPGWDVKFGEPPGVDGYDDVMTRGLQAVGAATGVPYEELSGDYSKVNFSSARMARAAFHALLDELQWQVFIPGFCERVFGWFVEAAVLQGYRTADCTMEWTTPRKTLVDPAREIPAAIAGARATLTSPQELMRELGFDPKTTLNEWEQFAAWLDEAGLVSDIDPRRTTSQGARVTPALPSTDTPDPPPARARTRRKRPHLNGNGSAPPPAV